jgi:hypothetical protein
MIFTYLAKFKEIMNQYPRVRGKYLVCMGDFVKRSIRLLLKNSCWANDKEILEFVCAQASISSNPKKERRSLHSSGKERISLASESPSSPRR